MVNCRRVIVQPVIKLPPDVDPSPHHHHGPPHHVIINAQCGSVVILEMALYRGHLVLNEPAQQKCLHSEADAHEERQFSYTSLVSF